MLMPRWSAALVVSSALVVACGDDGEVATDGAAGEEAVAPLTPVGDREALDRCEARRFATAEDLALVGAFSTDVGTLRSWMPRASATGDDLPTALATEAEGDAVTVCFIDGTFDTPGPPGHTNPDRAVFYVDESGYGEPVRWGTRESLPLERPG